MADESGLDGVGNYYRLGRVLLVPDYEVVAGRPRHTDKLVIESVERSQNPREYDPIDFFKFKK